MKTTHRLAMLLTLFGVVIGNSRSTAFQAVDSIASVENILYINLKEVINKGVDLYNGGDIAGCYRLFEGTLRTIRPLLTHRAGLVKEIEEKLDVAEKEPVTWRKAFALRAALDKIRTELKPKPGFGEAKTSPAKPSEPVKPMKDEKKKVEDETKKKADEALMKKKADEDAKNKEAADAKKKADEEAKKKQPSEDKKKADNEDKKKTESVPKPSSEPKKGNKLGNPMELSEKKDG
ncbi:MAG: hypothetical protein EBV06_02235 [Planctomycetia bacterium]|nr:hypothetical protein [Planctomycetia bacterium]